MTHESHTLNELIQVLRDGEAFYTDAAQKVEAPVYRNLFQRMARIKCAIANELAAYATAGNARMARDSMMDLWEPTYADKRVGIGKAAEKIYLTLLEETEDQILDVFRSHLRYSDSTAVCAILYRRMPEAQRAHDEMRDLMLRLDRASGRVFPSPSAQASPANA
jgi:uncharacterized protein (TIGR02284 family)